VTYLDEAAKLLRAARDANERRAELAATVRDLSRAGAVMREVNDRRMEIAAAFTRLAAIERGLAPAFGAPEPGEEEQAGG